MKVARARAGFTLAEVAVTLLIVSIGLLLVLQSLNAAKITAAQTRNTKLARELGLLELGQIEAGELRDDIETGSQGSFSDEGHPDFTWEVALGDDSFRQRPDTAPFDSWAPRSTTSSASSSTTSDDDQKKKDDEDEEQPYERVKVRVTMPKLGEYQNELILERWMPWKQVYGEVDATDGKASKNKKASKGKAATAASTNTGASAPSGAQTPTTGGKSP